MMHRTNMMICSIETRNVLRGLKVISIPKAMWCFRMWYKKAEHKSEMTRKRTEVSLVLFGTRVKCFGTWQLIWITSVFGFFFIFLLHNSLSDDNLLSVTFKRPKRPNPPIELKASLSPHSLPKRPKNPSLCLATKMTCHFWGRTNLIRNNAFISLRQLWLYVGPSYHFL